jgi:hypothetical protein
MQQFFGLVDTLLAGSPGAKQRRLGYRTYRVVPCSPLVGVLEWVEGTSPLTDYLLGDRNTLYNGGASARSVLTCQGCVLTRIRVASHKECTSMVPYPLLRAAALTKRMLIFACCRPECFDSCVVRDRARAHTLIVIAMSPSY